VRLFRMKHPIRFFTLGPVALGMMALVAVGTTATPSFARKKNPVNQLQIWPGQRALIVLPLQINPNFLNGDSETPVIAPVTTTPNPAMAPPVAPVSPPATGSGDGSAPLTAAPDAGMMAGVPSSSGSGELASALVPLVSAQLSRSLQNTGKFSLTLPYLFDPLLRRALEDQQLSADELDTFVKTPTLEAAQATLPKLSLDQPGMVAKIALENLQVGGTPQSPTVQVRMHGDLYQVVPGAKRVVDGAQQNDPPVTTLFRSITVTSKDFPGRTPEDRLRAATGQAFDDIAAAFIERPSEFQLPLPIAPPTSATGTGKGTPGKAGMVKPGSKGTGTMGRGTTGTGSGTMPNGTMVPLTPAVPGTAPLTAPNVLSPAPNTPVAPTLPPATPPLGLNVPAQGN
jgi:hypothetical protein